MRPPPLQAIANPVQAIGSRSLAGGTRAGTAPPYGLTMWFNVLVPGLDDDGPKALGSWSGCSGLGVELTPEGPIEDGGNFGLQQFLPGKISYGKVVLERAMTAAGAKQVREWLEQLEREWAQGGVPPDGERPPVVVQLFSGLGSNGGEIHQWELRNAIPVKWEVPSLSTKGGDIAIEKLTLAHGGFLKGVERNQRPKLSLGVIGDPGSTLEFQYNPAKITYGKTREKVDKVDRDSLKIAVDDLRMEGCEPIDKAISLLENWAESVKADPPPQNAPAPAGGTDRPPDQPAGNDSASQVLLELKWGSFGKEMPKVLVLKGFELNFIRFTADGRPSRATVRLTLQVKDRKPGDAKDAAGGRP
jgi:phage tail-like protein